LLPDSAASHTLLVVRSSRLVIALKLQRASDQGSRWYDMWGLATSGIAHFKAGWGGDVHAYPGALDLDLDPIRGPLVRLALRVRRVAS
jgi:lipid II:glycine glycyltransferase (peptidoglycan interpeptide bridge formation enzyme)